MHMAKGIESNLCFNVDRKSRHRPANKTLHLYPLMRLIMKLTTTTWKHVETLSDNIRHIFKLTYCFAPGTNVIEMNGF